MTKSAARKKALARAVELLNQGRHQEAREYLEGCARDGLESGVDEIMAWAGQLARNSAGRGGSSPLGGALAAGGHLRAFQEAERALAEDTAASYRLLRDLWLNGAYEIPETAARSPWGRFFLSSQSWKRGRTLEALAHLDRGASFAPRYGWMRYYTAELLVRRLDLYELARREIDKVVKSCPWLWEARCLRAEILWSVGAKGPLEGLEDAAVPKSSRSAFLAWRGALGLWTGRYAAALEDLDAAALLGNPDAPCWRGGTKVMLGDLDAAVRDLSALLAADPRDHEARVWRGEAYRRLGRPRQSLADLDAALSRGDDALWALVNRALVHLEIGDLAKARDDAARLAPPRFDGLIFVYDSPSVDAERLRGLLEAALKSARGCRRSDPHLNFAWMKRDGIAIPARPEPNVRFLYWLREKAPALVQNPDSEFAPKADAEGAPPKSLRHLLRLAKSSPRTAVKPVKKKAAPPPPGGSRVPTDPTAPPDPKAVRDPNSRYDPGVGPD